MLEEGAMAEVANPANAHANDQVVELKEKDESTKPNLQAIRYGEDLMEALDKSHEFIRECESYQIDMEKYEETKATIQTTAPEAPKPEFIYDGKGLFAYILESIKKVRSSEIENTLRFFSFAYSVKLLYFVEHFIRTGIEIELMTRILMFLLRSYEGQIRGNAELKKIMVSICQNLKTRTAELKSTIGTNSAGIKLLKHQIKMMSDNRDALDFE